MSMNNVQIMEGYLVKNTCPFSREQVEIEMQSDKILKRGLLFVGGARQGKTSVIKKIASDMTYELIYKIYKQLI